MAKFVHKPTPPVESVSPPTPEPAPLPAGPGELPGEHAYADVAGVSELPPVLLPGESIVPSIDEFEMNPEVEKALPWGPPEAYRSRKSGRWMYVRRSSHILGSLGGFWDYYRKRKDFLVAHGVRLRPQRNPDGTAVLSSGHKVWDATWWLPRKGKVKVDPRVDPDSMIGAIGKAVMAASPLGGERLVSPMNHIRTLMKRLSTTKASAWPEYAAVQKMLDHMDAELEDIE